MFFLQSLPWIVLLSLINTQNVSILIVWVEKFHSHFVWLGLYQDSNGFYLLLKVWMEIWNFRENFCFFFSFFNWSLNGDNSIEPSFGYQVKNLVDFWSPLKSRGLADTTDFYMRFLGVKPKNWSTCFLVFGIFRSCIWLKNHVKKIDRSSWCYSYVNGCFCFRLSFWCFLFILCQTENYCFRNIFLKLFYHINLTSFWFCFAANF